MDGGGKTLQEVFHNSPTVKKYMQYHISSRRNDKDKKLFEE